MLGLRHAGSNTIEVGAQLQGKEENEIPYSTVWLAQPLIPSLWPLACSWWPRSLIGTTQDACLVSNLLYMEFFVIAIALKVGLSNKKSPAIQTLESMARKPKLGLMPRCCNIQIWVQCLSPTLSISSAEHWVLVAGFLCCTRGWSTVAETRSKRFITEQPIGILNSLTPVWPELLLYYLK